MVELWRWVMVTASGRTPQLPTTPVADGAPLGEADRRQGISMNPNVPTINAGRPTGG